MILDLLGIIFSFGVVILGGLWCVYYIHHAVKVKRKIRALKRCTEHFERESYINGVTEYKKSIFIVIISFTESWLHVFYWEIISDQFIYFHSINRTHGFLNLSLEKSLSFDFLITVSLSLFILMSSLVCVLTSYLTKAYGTNRETKLKEKKLFIWMFLQLFVGWGLCLIPKTRTIGLPLYALWVFIGQIFVYIRVSKGLYFVLRRRREDAYFEDRELHTKMVRMCKSFKHGAIAYIAVLVLFLSELTAEIVKHIFIDIFIKENFLYGYIDPLETVSEDSSKIILRHLRIYLHLLSKMIAMLMLFFSLMAHLSVVVKAIMRGFQRKKYLRDQINGVNNMFRVPLIGEN